MCWERYFLKCVVYGDRRHLKYDFDKRCTFSNCNRNNLLIGEGDPQINQINTPDTCERCTTGGPPPSLPQQGAQGLEASSFALPPVSSQSVDPQISAGPADSAPQPSKQCLRCFQIGQSCTWSQTQHNMPTDESSRCDQCRFYGQLAKHIKTYDTSKVPEYPPRGFFSPSGKCFYCALDARQCNITKDSAGETCDRCFDYGKNVQLDCVREFTQAELEAERLNPNLLGRRTTLNLAPRANGQLIRSRSPMRIPQRKAIER